MQIQDVINEVVEAIIDGFYNGITLIQTATGIDWIPGMVSGEGCICSIQAWGQDENVALYDVQNGLARNGYGYC